MPKNIVVFSDGTGQAGGINFDEARTNVYKLYRACREAYRARPPFHTSEVPTCFSLSIRMAAIWEQYSRKICVSIVTLRQAVETRLQHMAIILLERADTPSRRYP
jgi:hypothetical protein